jgi:hypothetical protein
MRLTFHIGVGLVLMASAGCCLMPPCCIGPYAVCVPPPPPGICAPCLPGMFPNLPSPWGEDCQLCNSALPALSAPHPYESYPHPMQAVPGSGYEHPYHESIPTAPAPPPLDIGPGYDDDGFKEPIPAPPATGNEAAHHSRHDNLGGTPPPIVYVAPPESSLRAIPAPNTGAAKWVPSRL